MQARIRVRQLQLRNYSPHAQRTYIRRVADFAKHFKAPPEQLGPEHIREYQMLPIQQKKLSWSPFNQAVCAQRFFYNDVLHRNWMIDHIPYPRHEAKLPVVLSPAEVAAVSEAISNLKHRMILMTIYAAGLRVSEVTHLRVTDIDSQRQLIRIGQAKGHKDRQVMFSPKLLEALWTYWKRMGRSRVGPSNKWRLSIHGASRSSSIRTSSCIRSLGLFCRL
jgi:integrase/recombinase XerD